jgi:four helix bundle protein
MSIQRFEELKVWQDARLFTGVIYQMTATDPFKKDFGLKTQIQRAAVSVMSNIAEGYERDNNKELVRFLHYSKGSMGEVRSLLCVALDLSYISEDEFLRGKESAIAISKQLANFTKYLRTRIAKSC